MEFIHFRAMAAVVFTVTCIEGCSNPPDKGPTNVEPTAIVTSPVSTGPATLPNQTVNPPCDYASNKLPTIQIDLKENFFRALDTSELCNMNNFQYPYISCIKRVYSNATYTSPHLAEGTAIDLDIESLFADKTPGLRRYANVVIALHNGSISHSGTTNAEFLVQDNDPDPEDDVPQPGDPTFYTLRQGVHTPVATLTYDCRTPIILTDNNTIEKIMFRVGLIPVRHIVGHMNIAILLSKKDAQGKYLFKMPLILDPAIPNKGVE